MSSSPCSRPSPAVCRAKVCRSSCSQAAPGPLPLACHMPPFSSRGLLCHHPYVGHRLPYAMRKVVTCHVCMQFLGYRCSLAICPLSLWGLLCYCSHVGNRPPCAVRKVVAPRVCMPWAALLTCHIPTMPAHAITVGASMSVMLEPAVTTYHCWVGKPSIQKVGEKLMIQQ